MKLKERIKKWLFYDEMKKLVSLEEAYESLYVTYEEVKSWYHAADRMYTLSHEAKVNCEASQKELVECKKLLNQICDVGVDVGFTNEEHSWAVVCVAGKPEYVKFIPLNNKDARSVINFLKQFQYSRYVIDSPFAFKRMLKDMIVKAEF